MLSPLFHVVGTSIVRSYFLLLSFFIHNQKQTVISNRTIIPIISNCNNSKRTSSILLIWFTFILLQSTIQIQTNVCYESTSIVVDTLLPFYYLSRMLSTILLLDIQIPNGIPITNAIKARDGYDSLFPTPRRTDLP